MAQAPQGYRNADRLTSFVRFLLYAQVLAAVVVVASDVLEYRVLTDIQAAHSAFPDDLMARAQASDTRQHYVNLIDLVVLVVSGIAILRWIYVANANARGLGAKQMRFTPGACVWWYFIPVMALWRPFQAMREIWKASHDPADWQHADGAPILGIWWTLWIASNIVDQASFRLAIHADKIQELISANIVDQASNLLSIPLAFATLILVNGIYSAQQRSLARQALPA